MLDVHNVKDKEIMSLTMAVWDRFHLITGTTNNHTTIIKN